MQNTCRAVVLLAAASVLISAATNADWRYWGHDPGGQRFSPLTAITPANVSHLKIAWTFRTGDAYQPKNSRPTAFEATPLYFEGTLYIGTPLGRVIAIAPLTGKQRWAYDPKIDKDAGYGDYANRGVSLWISPTGSPRIFMATIDARLISLDAATGKPCGDFGDNGIVNLRNGLRIPARDPSDYEETSPPAIVGDTIVIGSGIADNGSTTQPSGEVRGFDLHTGKLKWTWDPIPQSDSDPASATWKNGSNHRTGAANAWSVIAADPARNLVFVPTGSASPDYYGGERVGANLYADSVVALKADTGKLVWHFQAVHHDLWDYDVASSPVLFEFHKGGDTIPAIAIGSKTGRLFILNRETGKPIFGVEEKPVPQTDVDGEVTSPTQPLPVKPAPLSRQRMTAADAWGSDEQNRKWCQNEIAGLRAEGIFTPPSVRGSLFMPGNIGGMAWGGAAFDPQNELLIIPVNNLAAEVKLIPRSEYNHARETGRRLNGDWEFAEQRGTPYGMMRRFLRAPNGLPCTAPPWGELVAIQASTGIEKWRVPVGQLPNFKGGPTLPTEYGSISLGGPIVTAGGVIFNAGTLDSAIYAFDVKSGKELWRGDLPTSARSVPITYQGPDGKQYVVVSAGGHGIPGAGPLGDYLIAFALSN